MVCGLRLWFYLVILEGLWFIFSGRQKAQPIALGCKEYLTFGEFPKHAEPPKGFSWATMRASQSSGRNSDLQIMSYSYLPFSEGGGSAVISMTSSMSAELSGILRPASSGTYGAVVRSFA